MRLRKAAVWIGLLVALPACDKPKQFTTTVEVLKIRRFGQNSSAGSVTEMELRYADCPGDARAVLRADRSFSACGAKLKRGDKVPAEVVHTHVGARANYRSEIVKIDGCGLKIDPKDEANYELVQQCRPVVATGMEVGIHCDRRRGPELVAKCPWLRRR
jgi:hypothetical protein